MHFTVFNLVDSLGNVRPFVLRTRKPFDFVAVRFSYGHSRFGEWYNSQSEWVICSIITYPDRYTFETCFGW